MSFKQILSAVLAVQMFVGSAFAGGVKLSEQELEKRMAAVDIKQMSDIEILSALQEIEGLIATRRQQLNSAEAKNEVAKDRGEKVFVISMGALTVLNFIVLAKAKNQTQGLIALFGVLGGTSMFFGYMNKSNDGDTILAKLHDTKMSKTDIGVARSRLVQVEERIKSLRVRIQHHLEIDRARGVN